MTYAGRFLGIRYLFCFSLQFNDSNVFTLEMLNDLCEVWFEMFVEMLVVVCVKCSVIP